MCKIHKNYDKNVNTSHCLNDKILSFMINSMICETKYIKNGISNEDAYCIKEGNML